MKSNKTKKMKKRILALLLCMVMMLNGSVSALASEVAVVNETTEAAHVHGEECYTHTKVSEEPKCGKETVEGHTHGDSCYEITNKQECICTQEETAGHSHDDSCFETEEIQVCTLEEHEHGGGCYTTEKELTCGQEESEEHTHDDGCYKENVECICEIDEHSHGSDCYITDTKNICGQEEKEAHFHEDACYTAVENKTLTCQLEEIESHTHGDECYEWLEELVCEIEAEELVPEEISEETVIVCETCQKEKCECEKEVENSLIQTLGETTVELSGAEEAFEAEKTYALQVNELEEEAAVMVAAAIKDVTRTANLEVLDYQAFDITLTADEEAAQPKAEVEVKFTGAKIEEYVATEDAEVKAFHVDAEGNAEEVNLTEGENEVSITTDHFSTYVVASVKAAEPVVLTTEADGTTITLSGPISAFAEGKTYEITAAKVEAEEELEVIEEALEAAAEEQEKVVESYQAFDIKIMATGEDGVTEEFQPLGPVQVTFSGEMVAESVANEETETNVIHVDTATGETQDMGATATEENDVAIETTHFSIYVVVDMNQLGGTINVKLEHWGTVETIDGTGTNYGNIKEVKLNTNTDANGRRYGFYTVDNVFDITGGGKASNVNGELVTQEYRGQIYTADDIVIPNKKEYGNIEDLSKICLESAQKEYVNKNYLIEKIWVSESLDNAGKEAEQWADGSYTEFVINRDADGNVTNEDVIRLTRDSLIRFWYVEKDVSSKYMQSVIFYDHNVSSGGVTTGIDKGTNIASNFNSYGNPNAAYKIGVGQSASGNKSTAWNKTRAYNKNGTNLGYLNCGNNWNEVQGVTADPSIYPLIKNGERNAEYPVIVTGIVKNELDDNGNLQFNDNVSQPGFFVESSGTEKYTNFKLGFDQTGDTYILSTVHNGSTEVLSNLETIRYSAHNNGSNTNIYSNEFWPLDTVSSYTGMDSKVSGGSDDGKTHNWHFGMKYEFTFTIGDYTGPMNYYFRGDDDFWLFIDGKKVVDLGGIHSAVGEAVDIRSWLAKTPGISQDKNAEHKITIYYMERGGFGSCCYMQFTLPNCKSVNSPSAPTTTYKVSKVWVDDLTSRPDEIQVELLRTDSAGIVTTVDTQILNVDNNWYYEWNGLPANNVNNSSITYSYAAREMNVPEGYISTNTASGNTATITNTQIIDIPVEKIWSDQDNKYNTQSDGVQVKLFANDNVVRDSGGNEWILTLNSECDWKGTWTGVPKYSDNGPITYRVEEVHVPDNYTVAYSTPEGLNPGDDGFKFTVTNTLKVLPLKLVKQDADTSIELAGAKFKLESVTYPNAKYDEVTTGITGSIDFGELPYGEYKLIEIQAPVGYALNDYHFHIEISEEGVKAVKHENNQSETDKLQFSEEDITEVKDENNILQYYELKVDNEKLYALPSTGGMGTDMFKISGLALMSGAALFLHKKKEDEEVQG